MDEFIEFPAESRVPGLVLLEPGTAYTVPDIDAKGAKEVIVQVINGNMALDGEISGGSQSLQVFVYGNPGIGYLTKSIKEMLLVPNSSEAVFIPTGYYEIKVIIVNKDAKHIANVSYKIIVKK